MVQKGAARDPVHCAGVGLSFGLTRTHFMRRPKVAKKLRCVFGQCRDSIRRAVSGGHDAGAWGRPVGLGPMAWMALGLL